MSLHRSDSLLRRRGWWCQADYRHTHHVAMLDRSGDLIFAPDDATRWRKQREKMSCLTLENWVGIMMGAIHRSSLRWNCH